MTQRDKLPFRVSELERRLRNVITRGTIAEADYGEAKVKVRLSGDLVTGWVPWMTQRAHGERVWDALEIGEQVVVVSPNGELGQGVAMAAIYYDAYPGLGETPDKVLRLHADGARDDYDRAVHRREIELPSAGSFLHKIGSATRNQTGLRIDDDADTITQTAGTASLTLTKSDGEVNVEGNEVHLTAGNAALRLVNGAATLTVGATSITLTAAGILMSVDGAVVQTTVAGRTTLEGEVILGGDGGKPIARHDDTVVNGKVVATSALVEAS